jgi:hypothetical protein
MEETRLAVCDAFARSGGAARPHLTLAQIIEQMPDQEKTAMQGLRERLKERIRQLNAVNTSNRIMLEERLHEVAATLGIITRYEEKFGGYQRYGARENRVHNRTIINRVA